MKGGVYRMLTLCGKKQEQKNSTSQVQDIKQETGQRAAPRQKRGRGI